MMRSRSIFAQRDVVAKFRRVGQQANRGDRHTYSGRTRFITDEMMTLFDYCVWPVLDQASENANGLEANFVAPIDLGARLRALFDRAGDTDRIPMRFCAVTRSMLLGDLAIRVA